MLTKRYTSVVMLGLTIGVLTAAAPFQGQGKGQGKGHGNENKGEQADVRGAGQGKSASDKGLDVKGIDHGNGKAKGLAKAQQSGERRDNNPGKSNSSKKFDHPDKGVSSGMGATLDRGKSESAHNNVKFVRDLRVNDLRPSVRKFVVSNKAPERLAAGAVAYAYARGKNERDFVITPNGDRILVKNRKGNVLLDLDDDESDKLGKWKVNVLNDEVKEGSPSFCRSGAGHPVWGRQWCFNKGFGLGTDQNWRWGSANNLDQAIILRPTNTTATIASDVLAGILGNVVTDRLALHAITLGLVDPLVGRWLGEPNGERVLLVSSGSTPVAEFVDLNRDDRADRLYVALKPW